MVISTKPLPMSFVLISRQNCVYIPVQIILQKYFFFNSTFDFNSFTLTNISIPPYNDSLIE